MWRHATLLFAGYLVLGIASTAFVFQPEGIATLWLPSGLTLVVLARTPRRTWGLFIVAIISAEILVCTYLGRPWPIRIGWGIADALEPVIAALLLQRRRGTRVVLANVSDMLVFVSAATISAAASGLCAAVFSTLWLPDATFFGSLGTWVVGDLASQLSVGAFGLAWAFGPRRRSKRSERVVEALVIIVGLSTTSVLVFSQEYSSPAIEPFPYLVFPFVVWAALRFGVRGASAGHAMVALIASFLTARGRGPFALSMWSSAERVLALELFFAVNMLMLFLGAAIEAQYEALLSRDRFLGLAAHELRTPLTALRINLRLLRAKLSPELIPRADASIRQVQKLSRLAEDLLDVSKIAKGTLTLQPELLDLADVVRGVCALLLGEPSRAGLAISFELRPCRVVGDAHLIEQLVRNLVENAMKYSEGQPISVRTEPSDGSVFLWVKDQGRGIAKEDQARIFDAYERAASELLYPGLGLGLYLCRKIVDAHGGRITLQSELGKGTEIAVELPANGP